ncbi:hypothetical protein BV20DRAFT_969889 [Pilatotrama ljubarskyi]|nr:hypothetical protein BV20DRAFT_969889 [Pilatotrama ljubarskyi]
MSSPTATVYIHTTPSASLPVASAATTPPPIVEIARVAGRGLALSLSYLSRGSIAAVRYLLSPLSLLYIPVLYLLGPVIVLSQVLLDVLVYTPYSIIATVVRNVYPIYVFVGAACICAAFFGFLARLVATSLVYAIFAPRPPSPVDSPEAPPEKVAVRPAAPKTRLRKRVSIKEER